MKAVNSDNGTPVAACLYVNSDHYPTSTLGITNRRTVTENGETFETCYENNNNLYTYLALGLNSSVGLRTYYACIQGFQSAKYNTLTNKGLYSLTFNITCTISRCLLNTNNTFPFVSFCSKLQHDSQLPRMCAR